MNRQLKQNILINLQFYRRNRLLLIVGILFLAIMLLTMIPSFFFNSSNQRFMMASQIYHSIYGFLMVIVALIALMSIHYHRSNRCIKLIFTKPYSPEQWVFSHYASVSVLFGGGMLVALLIYLVLSLCWSIPLQIGILAALAYAFAQALQLYSLLLALSSWVHPIVAVVLMLVFSDGTFYWLTLMCRAGAEAVESGILHYLLAVLDKAFCAIYYALPTTSLFGEKLSTLQSGFRLGEGNGIYLLGHLAYAAVFVSLCYLLSVYSLRRRQMT